MASAPQNDLELFLRPFGLSEFRPGQREVITAVMAGQDCLCVMPTGGGKSLCYQLPAIARHGLTLVVSPLIALMKDQVDSLVALGLRATFINSTLTPDEQAVRLNDMAAGHYDLVYVVPERFRSPRFLEAVGRSSLQLLAIDEAHCVSEWGHDFRPDYAKLGRFRRELGSPPTIALTATATDTVRRDIIELLDLRDCQSFVTGFARPNLFHEVRTLSSQREKEELLLGFLQKNRGPGIIYASTRKRCEDLVQLISRRAQCTVGMYHAGMLPAERRAAQEAFMEGRIQIVVATLAFGMGIDKADVRFVIHFNLPGSLEAYYQEAGRAGRDGQRAHCLLMSTAGDRYIHEFFIESAYPSPEIVEQVYDYLRRLDSSPIELTQQELKEVLKLQIGAEGVGACEKLLEQAGAIERLEAVENMAAVRLNSDLPTLVDLLPTQAKTKRRVLRAVERVVGTQRDQWVYFQQRDLGAELEVDSAAISRTLRELSNLDTVDYIPPFRGRAIHVTQRERSFTSLGIDFDVSQRRKAAEYEKLNVMARFASSRRCRQKEILSYFGQRDSADCQHCDNCQSAKGSGKTVRAPSKGERGVLEAVRIVLSGVARAHGRCGKQLLAQMLCGSNSEKVLRNRLNRLSTYGLLSHLRQTEVVELVDSLIAAQYISQTDVDRFRPVLQLTPRGTEVMSGRAELSDLPLGVELIKKLWHTAAPQPPGGQQAPQAAERQAPSINGPAKRLAQEGAEAVSSRPLAPDAIAPESDEAPPCDASGALLNEARDNAAPGDLSMPPPSPQPTIDPAAVDPLSAPSHYWTWRLLSAGISPRECAAARGLSEEVVLDHALRAIDSGWPVRAAWLLSPQKINKLAELIGPDAPERIRPLLSRLPHDVRYEEVMLFVKCRAAWGADAVCAEGSKN